MNQLTIMDEAYSRRLAARERATELAAQWLVDNADQVEALPEVNPLNTSEVFARTEHAVCVFGRCMRQARVESGLPELTQHETRMKRLSHVNRTASGKRRGTSTKTTEKAT